MPYIFKEFDSILGEKIENSLKKHITYNNSFIEKLLDKGRVLDENSKRYKKNQIVKSKKIKLYIFEPQSKGLKPIFENYHFAIFDKNNGVKVHPVSVEDNDYTLLDEIKAYDKNASFINRIDKETSGLIVVSKNKFADFTLKEVFEERNVVKKYQALVHGHVKNETIINERISSANSKIKLKMAVNKEGKESITSIKPLKYFQDKNQTLVEAEPKTGRQHQIRVHLDFIEHPIIGDPIYGIDENIADKILKNEIIKNDRLMLHSNYIEFEFMGIVYKIKSRNSLI